MVTFKKIQAIFAYTVVYSAAIAASWLVLELFLSSNFQLSFLTRVFLANLVASFVIFLACILFNTFSINDPFWTLQATCLSIYYFIQTNQTLSKTNYDFRSLLVLVLINVWSLRLTYNLISTGLSHCTHEDWRFSAFRSQWKPRPVYFIIGLLAFIIMPNTVVYVACVPIYYVFSSKTGGFNLFDWLAMSVTLLGICFESIADYQLHKEIARKRKDDPDSIPCMDKGLWSLCRHPNYFGEITFWFGVYLFGLSSAGITLDFDAQFNLFVFLFGPFAVFVLIYFGSLVYI